ncbi:MAG: VWA domain-containing protein [Pyrinomonadaceae bacterium]|nr:VWA domain-containing protein [Pyrinomonadaceae bacterium]
MTAYPAPQLSQQQMKAQTQTASTKSGDEELMLTVTVSNKRLVPFSGLSKEAFTVMDDKTPREITSFSNDDAPHSIGVIFDMSGSMSEKKLTRPVALFFDNFLNASNRANEYFIMAFAERPVIAIDWTTDISDLLAKLLTANTRGQTALYDALYAAIEKAKTGRYRPPALIVFTDGQDNNSKHTFSQVRELLKESDVTFYGILINGGTDPGSSQGEAGKSILSELASITGGRSFNPLTKKQEQEAFETIAAELKYQYRIGFKPLAATGKPKWRSIKVKVTQPENAPPEFRNLTVRTREGYYPKQ